MAEESEKMLAVAAKIISGELTRVTLLCPYCGRPTLLFSFTRVVPERYGLFIECLECGQRAHFHLPSRPKNFSASLVLPRYQHLEDYAYKLAQEAVKKFSMQKPTRISQN